MDKVEEDIKRILLSLDENTKKDEEKKEEEDERSDNEEKKSEKGPSAIPQLILAPTVPDVEPPKRLRTGDLRRKFGIEQPKGETSIRVKNRQALAASSSDATEMGFPLVPANTVQSVVAANKIRLAASYDPMAGIDSSKYYIGEAVKKKVAAMLKKSYKC
jgi:hypothetical protein